MKIGIIGTGYVGLVTGTCFADSGNDVICVDVDQEKVERMRNGEVPIYEPGLNRVFDRAIRDKRLEFTTDLEKALDRKSTRLNSSHVANSYAVLSLKKK